MLYAFLEYKYKRDLLFVALCGIPYIQISQR